MSSVAAPVATDTAGMGYLETRSRRFVTVWLPLLVFLVVLLFPFYWMAMTSVKPDAELISRAGNPFWVKSPTLEHFRKLLFETTFPQWAWNTVMISVVATFGSLVAAVLAAYAIELAAPSPRAPPGIARWNDSVAMRCVAFSGPPRVMT